MEFWGKCVSAREILLLSCDDDFSVDINETTTDGVVMSKKVNDVPQTVGKHEKGTLHRIHQPPGIVVSEERRTPAR